MVPYIQKQSSLLVSVLVMLIILIYGRPFLIPISIATLLSLLFIPLTQTLEKKHFHPILASFSSILILLGFITFLILFIKWQIGTVLTDIEKEVLSRFQEIREYISEHFGLTIHQQQELFDQQKEAVRRQAGSFLVSNVRSIGRLIGDFILVIVYTFLFIHYRKIIKQFIIQLFPDKAKELVILIMHQVQSVAFKYLKGMSMMIIMLWVMYGIGFSVAGIKHPFFFAILCGILEIVPFIGNLTGTTITVFMTIAQGGGTGMIIGIITTYGAIQFIQSYFLEPLIVGAGVRINPLFTILSLVAGECIWGIAGMILALPFLGMIKVIFEYIQPLRSISSLISNSKKESTTIT